MSTVTHLTWIHLSEPSKRGADRELRLRIRRHVTTLQHKRRKVLAPARRAERSELQGAGKQEAERVEYCNIFDDAVLFANTLPIDPTVVANLISGLCDLYPPPRLLCDPTDDLDFHIRKLGANVPDVLRYYGRIVDRQAPRFRSMSSLPPLSSTGPNRLIPYLTTHPALLAAASLLVISGMRAFRPDIIESTEASVLQLRLYTIGTVQKAVDAGEVSDQLILAVGLLVVYETIFGRLERYHVHGKGLRDMVRLRGGLENLGLGGLVEALVLWYDAGTANINGCVPYLDGIPRSKRERSKVDREHFLCWVPDGRLQQEKAYLDVD